jgi:hypothetical protein
MTAIFSDFDSTMTSRVQVNTQDNTVDVTFRKSGSTYRYSLDEAGVADVVALITSRSKGKLLHQLLDISNGVRVDEPQVATKSKTVSTKATPKNTVKASPTVSRKAPRVAPTLSNKPTVSATKSTRLSNQKVQI